MASFNKVFLMGNLTRDPELRQLASGQAVCTLRLAVSRPYRTASGESREDTLYVDVVAWGRQAETSNTYLRKGSSVFIEGSLRLEQWQDKTTGQARQRHSVTAERVQFLNSSRGDGGSQQGNSQYQQAAPVPSAQPQAPSYMEPVAPSQAPPPVQQNSYAQPPQGQAMNVAPVAAPPTFEAVQQAPQVAQQAPQSMQAEIPPAPVFDVDDVEDDIPF